MSGPSGVGKGTIREELMKKEINGRSIKDILEPKEEKPQETLTVDVASPNKEEWKEIFTGHE